MIPVFVPATELREATELYLRSPALEPEVIDPVVVDLDGEPWSYNAYLAGRWRVGQAFVNMEHDIVPWPGAITALWQCPEPWCAYGYLPSLDMTGNSLFGLVKFSAELIEQLPRAWDDMRTSYDTDPLIGNYTRWSTCDMWFSRYALDRGAACHQHYPSVFNANPSIRLYSPDVRRAKGE